MDAGTVVLALAGLAGLLVYRSVVLVRWRARLLSTERAAFLFALGLPTVAVVYVAVRHGVSPVLVAACALFFAVQFLALRYMLGVFAEDRPH